MARYAPLPDQLERDRFCTELETNYSVIAPAGVGKTTSIVARIIAIAKADARRLSDPILPRLVVVTYTKKAADEMFSRVRTELDREQPHADVHAHLAQAFFGTIHSFCQRLLLLAGPLCGFPSEAEIVTDTDRLWERFRRESGSDSQLHLPADLARGFALFGQWEDVFKLAKDWPGLPEESPLPGLPPRISAEAIAAIEPKGRAKDNILLGQALFHKWVSDISLQLKNRDPLPCPEPDFKKGGKGFIEAWRSAVAPLREWRSEVTQYLAAQVALSFARYRRRTGQFTFDDLIHFARHLLKDKDACSILRRRNWRVILDEAQDTDPEQFVILTEVARPVEAEGCWIEGAEQGPCSGAFSMVGDPQQSIYSDRADLGRYLDVHQRLLADGGERATFSVTMRCPLSVVAGLNETFPVILCQESADSRQVEYVELDNPNGAAQGQMIRFNLSAPDPEGEARSPVRESGYVQHLAQWLKNMSPEALGTDSWGKVAILCPRNRWLDAVADALTAVELPIQQFSRSALRADNPVHAWFTALLVVFAHPRDSFEIYGVLRDVFGFSDDTLVRYIDSHYVHGDAHPLRLDRPAAESPLPVAKALNELHHLYLRVREMALYEAVESIIDHCQLAQRLGMVPGIEVSSIEVILDNLIQQTAEAEGTQTSLTDWAEEQRRALFQPLDERESSEESITLVTAHKSKGLGFDVVILPFFYRKFGMPPEHYPCFESGGVGRPRVLFSADDRDTSALSTQEARRKELHERLLYVALTRVKRSLILFDDRAWWSDLRSQKGISWAELFKIDGASTENVALWNALSTGLQPPISPAPKAVRPAPEQICHKVVLPEAFPQYWRRVTPSSLQRHEAPSERVEPDIEGDERFPEEVRELYLKDPAAYGNWWHDMMEHTPWDMEEEIVRIHFQNTVILCPDINRGARELDRFLQSSLFSILVQPEWEVHTEVPFLAGHVLEKTGYEGFIDLLAINKDSGEWMIIDWKTDRFSDKDPMAALKYAYAPQLEVYDTALRQSLGDNGTSALYSTVYGETVALQK